MSVDKIKEKVVKHKKLFEYGFLAMLVLVVIAVFLSNFLPNNANTLSIDEYVSGLETRLSKILSEVENCGKVNVMITVDSGIVNVLAEEQSEKETSTGKEITVTPIVINGETVILKSCYPEITGVLIVAEGANSISVKTKILQAVSSVLNVSTDKIEILTKK